MQSLKLPSLLSLVHQSPKGRDLREDLIAINHVFQFNKHKIQNTKNTKRRKQCGFFRSSHTYSTSNDQDIEEQTI